MPAPQPKPSNSSGTSSQPSPNFNLRSASGVPLLNVSSLYETIVDTSFDDGSTYTRKSLTDSINSPQAANPVCVFYGCISVQEFTDAVVVPCNFFFAILHFLSVWRGLFIWEQPSRPARARIAADYVLDALEGQSVELRVDHVNACCGALSRHPAYQFAMYAVMTLQMCLIFLEPPHWRGQCVQLYSVFTGSRTYFGLMCSDATACLKTFCSLLVAFASFFRPRMVSTVACAGAHPRLLLRWIHHV